MVVACRTVIRLLRRVSCRELALRRGRTALLLGAVATGVALIVAIGVINTSVLASFRRAFEAAAGPSDLEITLGSGEVGFDEALVARARAERAVADAVPLVRGTVAPAADPSDALQLFGAELTAEDSLTRYGVRLASARRAALSMMDDTRGVLVSEAAARRLGVDVGSSLPIVTARGVVDYTVRGLLAPNGLAAALAGQLVVMDLAAAQAALAKEGRVDQIDLVLARGADPAAVARRLAAALPAGFAVGSPVTRAARYADVLRGLQTTFVGMSLMCMIAGLFVIYNAMSASVVHRMPVLMALRLLGADGSTVFRLILAEAALLGVLGSLVGVVVGVALARLLLSLVGTTLGTMVQIRFIVPAVSVEPRALLGAALLGTAAAVAAAWIPARRTLRPILLREETPVAAARARLGGPTALWLLALATAVGAVLAGEASHEGPLVIAGATLFFLAGAAIGVPFVGAAAGSVERWLPRLHGIEGRVAAASVTRATERAGMTVAAIAYVFAIAVTLAAIIESYVVAARDFVADLQDGDLVVSAVATEGGWLEAPVGPEIAAAIAAVPGVARVEPARIVPGQHFRRGRVGILAVEPAALLRLRPRLWRAGDFARGRAALAAGEAVAVSTVFADVHGVAVGDGIEIESPTGTFTLPVGGLVNDMTSSSGSILMSRALYAARWGDPTVSRMNVYLAPGVGVEEAQRRIVAAVGAGRRLKIDALGQALAYVDGKIRDAFAFSRSLQLLIVIVAVAGIFDLLFARIFERRRELATWRVMGASDATVRRSVVVESLALGVLASMLGLPLGIATAWLWVKHVIPSLVGYDIVMLVPARSCIGTFALVLAATVVAGRAAATTAGGAPILDGLRSD